MLHLEGAEPIGPGLDELEVLHAAGLRSLGLSWSRPNAFATGVPFGFPGSPDQGPGPDRPRARARRARAASCGVLVDVSHLNARGFWDVAELLDGPARRLALRRARAVSLAAQPDRRAAARDRRARRPRRDQLPRRLPARGRRDDADTPLERIVEHAAHVAEVAGLDAVALGSDFDGATMPAALGDVAGLPALLDALRTVAGFGEAELASVARGNWRRVLAAAWAA